MNAAINEGGESAVPAQAGDRTDPQPGDAREKSLFRLFGNTLPHRQLIRGHLAGRCPRISVSLLFAGLEWDRLV
jgi:hypothetical protein